MTKQKWRHGPQFWSKLVHIYSDVLKHNPRSHMFVAQADALAKLGKTDEAIISLEDGLALYPHSRSAMVLLASFMSDEGRSGEAKQVLERVVAKWPYATQAVISLCAIYEKDGEMESAGKISAALLDHLPDSDRIIDLAARYDQSARRRAPDMRSPAEQGNDDEQMAGLDPFVDRFLDGALEDYTDDAEQDRRISRLKTVARLETMLIRIDRIKKAS